MYSRGRCRFSFFLAALPYPLLRRRLTHSIIKQGWELGVFSTYVHVWKTLPRDRLDPGSLEYSPQITGDCYKIWLRQSFCLSVSHNHSAARTVEG